MLQGQKGGKILYNGKIKIIKLLNAAGACYYGKGSKWCTAADTETGRKQFKNYNDHGTIYLIQPKYPGRHGKEKYQLAFEREHYMDETNTPVNLQKLVKKYPDIKLLLHLTYEPNIYIIAALATEWKYFYDIHDYSNPFDHSLNNALAMLLTREQLRLDVIQQLISLKNNIYPNNLDYQYSFLKKYVIGGRTPQMARKTIKYIAAKYN